ncbi:hypothetical protein HMPREF0004_4725 [Achromobacter piechaudii ATCC 43553]|uniref:Uncharacterized protein n=3 Tax=Achromobacter piechaudii TaxID=72556 RepID=D4XGX8_9BURK|nr:hypothetical protein HMPREF0004_4725 [Achromobacter piechaudii ATCC 43553]
MRHRFQARLIPSQELSMQPDYEPYVALYKYSVNTALAAATNYFDYMKQLRTLQLKTDKDLLAFSHAANSQIDGASSVEAVFALQQKFVTDLLGRELTFWREIEKIMRDASASSAVALRQSANPWQERLTQVAEDAAKFLANGNAARSTGSGNA